MNLLNRITHIEFDALRNRPSGILNGLATDAGYPADNGSLPDARAEIAQSWEAVKSLQQRLSGGSVTESLVKCREAVQRAMRLYDNIPIQPSEPRMDTK
jgi:hypothetical protein